ncbi:hypothetical protein EHO59_12515 [Leptospira semungkisensis]|uniref:DUF1795 domain-containing protein n=1 Tax=Leptospira semungkisensis TaxID=2484985 RepID=A0A4R9FQW6_9LEPT|nr:hypothetical protein [Leptospira semungkisensis]TGK00755.1 hypothetical protein EHO59_12515 [Leptospira semungkisensis]
MYRKISYLLIVFLSVSISAEENKKHYSALNLIIPFDWFQIEPFAGGIFAAKDFNDSATVLVIRKELNETIDQGAANKEFQAGMIEAVRGRNGRVIEAENYVLANHPAFRLYYKDKGSNLHTLYVTVFKENVMYGLMFVCLGEDPGKRVDIQKMLKRAYFRLDI